MLTALLYLLAIFVLFPAVMFGIDWLDHRINGAYNREFKRKHNALCVIREAKQRDAESQDA